MPNEMKPAEIILTLQSIKTNICRECTNRTCCNDCKYDKALSAAVRDESKIERGEIVDRPVKCGECRYHKKCGVEIQEIESLGFDRLYTFYCADGDRKDGAEK